MPLVISQIPSQQVIAPFIPVHGSWQDSHPPVSEKEWTAVDLSKNAYSAYFHSEMDQPTKGMLCERGYHEGVMLSVMHARRRLILMVITCERFIAYRFC